MPLETDFDPKVAAQIRAELVRFDGKCHYDETKKKIVYHSDQAALEAYLMLQRDEMERFKWLESEKSKSDQGQKALMEWVKQYSQKFARYWRKTHQFIPSTPTDDSPVQKQA